MQTDFSTASSSIPYLLGQIYDTSICQIDSAVTEEDIPFGASVQLGTDTTTNLLKVKKLTTGGSFLGIAIRSNSTQVGGVLAADANATSMVTVTTSPSSYPKGATVSFMRLGRIVISIPTGSTLTSARVLDSVYYTLADGKITTQSLGTAAPAGAVLIGSLYLPGATVGKLAVIQVNKLI